MLVTRVTGSDPGRWQSLTWRTERTATSGTQMCHSAACYPPACCRACPTSTRVAPAVLCVHCSADGRYFITTYHRGQVYVYDIDEPGFQVTAQSLRETKMRYGAGPLWNSCIGLQGRRETVQAGTGAGGSPSSGLGTPSSVSPTPSAGVPPGAHEVEEHDAPMPPAAPIELTAADRRLLAAASKGKCEVVSFLVNGNANVNCVAPTKAGHTPLTVAAAQGHGRVVQVLLEAGADVNMQTKVRA